MGLVWSVLLLTRLQVDPVRVGARMRREPRGRDMVAGSLWHGGLLQAEGEGGTERQGQECEKRVRFGALKAQGAICPALC